MPLLFLTYIFPSSRVAGERRRCCPTEDVCGGGPAGTSCCGEERAPPSLPLNFLVAPLLRHHIAVDHSRHPR
jgi:hypothetical protein